MPIKKPKAVKLPLPFADLSASPDADTRRRAVLMARELDTAGGFSWHRPRQSFAERLRALPGRLPYVLAACVVGVVLLFGLFTIGDIRIGPRIIYAESWGADRTAEDAQIEQEAAMDALRQRYAAHNAQVEAQEAARHAAALERERAAARAASPN